MDPSDNICGAPWLEIDTEDEDGNEITVCGCSRCTGERRRAARDEARIDEWEERGGGE